MAVIWDSIPEQAANIDVLRRASQTGHLAHGLLFSGPDAGLNRRMALGLAQFLVCETKGPCGQCGPCRRMELESSESLHVLQSENGVIKIDTVRDLKERLSLQAWHGQRVVLLEQAQTLNPQAANALLKSLEEPPEKTFFLLTTTHERSLMSTIRSRVQIVRVASPMSREVDWGDAETSTASFEVWRRLASGQQARGIDGLKELFSSRDQALETVRVWSILLHQARRLAVGLPAATSPAIEVLTAMSAKPLALDKGWRELMMMKAEIEGQVDRGLVADSFLLKLESEFRA